MTHHHSPLLPATPRLDRVLPAVATSLGVPGLTKGCLLYTSDAADDQSTV